MAFIDSSKIIFNYGGLAHIFPHDYEAICAYFLGQVRQCPTVDAVEVVRCKDCNHCHKLCGPKNPKLYCNLRGSKLLRDFGERVFPDHYCSYGRKRTERTKV